MGNGKKLLAGTSEFLIQKRSKPRYEFVKGIFEFVMGNSYRYK
jgi:hypothetical protein